MFNKSFPDLRFRFLWLAIGYSLVMLVVFLSLTSSPVDMGMHFAYEDKLYHAFAYFTLMIWFAQIYHDRLQRNMIALVFIVMGLGLEYLQSFDPARMAELWDMLANTSGVILALMLSLTKVKNMLVSIEKLIS